MAYNEIQVGRFLRAFQKYFSMKGTEPREITLAPEIMPGLNLPGFEDLFLHFGWNRFGVGFDVAAVAAQNTLFRLRNPAVSNVIALVERASCSEGATDTFTWELRAQATDLAGVTGPAPLDARQQQTNSSLILSVGNNIAAVSPFLHRMTGLASTEQFLVAAGEPRIPILPGWALTCSTTTVNVVLQGRLRWMERFLEESERT